VGRNIQDEKTRWESPGEQEEGMKTDNPNNTNMGWEQKKCKEDIHPTVQHKKKKRNKKKSETRKENRTW